jgi:transcriptional regulator with XRE-family HTH domain
VFTSAAKEWMLPVVKSVPTQKCEAQLLFAANMKRIRLANSLTQERLAEYAGLHANYISSVERGERNISICNIEKIASGLGVPMPDLLSQLPATDNSGS